MPSPEPTATGMTRYLSCACAVLKPLNSRPGDAISKMAFRNAPAFEKNKEARALNLSIKQNLVFVRLHLQGQALRF